MSLGEGVRRPMVEYGRVMKKGGPGPGCLGCIRG